jgi:guanylate kinase
MRDGEVEGEDYFFKTEEEFIDMVEAGEFYEHVSFNGWHYGTTVKQFFKDDVFIMTPHGISKIHEEDREKCFIIYFDIEESVRKERLMLRSDADTVDRRLVADENDFKNFVDFDLRITNHNF